MESDRKIYVQLAPDAAAVDALTRIGRALPLQKSGRLLPPRELHVTMIHFGKTRDVFAALSRAVTLTRSDFDAALNAYLTRTQKLITDDVYRLTPTGYARFGAHGSTLVGRYKAPARLHETHRLAYAELLTFFEDCGIDDPDTFAAHDANFKTARTFTPHATIYKGYDGPDPGDPLPAMDVRFMPLVYGH